MHVLSFLALPLALPTAAVSLVSPTTTIPTTASVPPAEGLSAAARRLAVAPLDGSDLLVFEADTGDAVASLPLPSPVTYASALTDDGRYLLAAHDDGVSVVDGGVWSDSHGDHAHHHAAEPRVIGHVAGDHPSHLISHDGLTALWFDDSGTATIVDEGPLADGELVTLGEVGAGEPHHGFAVPTANGRFFVTAMAGADDEGLPDALTVTDGADASAAEFACVDTHGEASFGRDIYAAACADGILVAAAGDEGWTSELVAYPNTDEVDPYGMGAARAWAIAPGNGVGAFGVGAFGTTHLFVLDPVAGALQVFDVGAQIATFGVQPLGADKGVLVLTTDGAVHRLDPFDGTIESSVAAIEPFADGADVEGAYTQLVVGGETAYVTDPGNHAVVALSLGDDLAVEATFDVGVEPAYLGVFNR